MIFKRQSREQETEMLQSGYRFALSLTHHREDAEDLVQQAWFNLSRRYGKVENRAILFTAIRNQFYDHCRRAKIVQFEAIENSPEPVNRVNDQNVSAARSDLDVLLGHLNEREREVLYLNCVEGFSASEISTQVGSPRGTVLSLLSRAKQKLSKIASGEGTLEGMAVT